MILCTYPLKMFLFYFRYVVIKKLGWGHFSTVWMIKDRQLMKREDSNSNSLYYAIKVQKSAEHYTEAAMDEVELLDCVAKERKRSELIQKKSTSSKDKDGVSIATILDHSRHVATLHDSFFHSGPNGRHMCMVFSMLGANLLSVIKAHNYRGIPLPAVKKMIKGMSKGLDFLHRKCLIIHTDLKPENVLLQFPGQINAENDSSDFIQNQDEEKVVSIEVLEAALQDPQTPTEERKKIRKKLKKRRQRERRRNGLDSDDDDIQSHPQKPLSDDAMEKMSYQNNPRSGPTRNAHERVLSRLSHSQFVMSNFTPRISTGNCLSSVINDMAKVSRPSKSDISTYFQLCNSQMGHKQRGGNGIAEVSFLLRAFVPEGEIADNISASLNGIPWEISEDQDTSREW